MDGSAKKRLAACLHTLRCDAFREDRQTDITVNILIPKTKICANVLRYRRTQSAWKTEHAFLGSTQGPRVAQNLKEERLTSKLSSGTNAPPGCC